MLVQQQGNQNQLLRHGNTRARYHWSSNSNWPRPPKVQPGNQRTPRANHNSTKPITKCPTKELQKTDTNQKRSNRLVPGLFQRVWQVQRWLPHHARSICATRGPPPTKSAIKSERRREKGIRWDIITKIQEGEPTAWVKSLVYQSSPVRCCHHRGPTQSVSVVVCNFIIIALDSLFASSVAIYR